MYYIMTYCTTRRVNTIRFGRVVFFSVHLYNIVLNMISYNVRNSFHAIHILLRCQLEYCRFSRPSRAMINYIIIIITFLTRRFLFYLYHLKNILRIKAYYNHMIYLLHNNAQCLNWKTIKKGGGYKSVEKQCVYVNFNR